MSLIPRFHCTISKALIFQVIKKGEVRALVTVEYLVMKITVCWQSYNFGDPVGLSVVPVFFFFFFFSFAFI